MSLRERGRRRLHRHGAAVPADLPESRLLQPWPVAAIVAQLLAPMVRQPRANPGRSIGGNATWPMAGMDHRQGFQRRRQVAPSGLGAGHEQVELVSADRRRTKRPWERPIRYGKPTDSGETPSSMGSLTMASARLAGCERQIASATGRASKMLMAPLALRPSPARKACKQPLPIFSKQLRSRLTSARSASNVAIEGRF